MKLLKNSISVGTSLLDFIEKLKANFIKCNDFHSFPFLKRKKTKKLIKKERNY